MFTGFIQGALVAVVIIFTQTNKYIHCDDILSAVDDSHVLLLTKDTFTHALKNNQCLFVKFVSPGCDYCKGLSLAFAAAARQLVDFGTTIKFASVDGTIERDLTQNYHIKFYPSIKLFMNSSVLEYTGGYAPNDFVSWLMKKTDDLKNFKEANEVVVTGTFEDIDRNAAASFHQVAETMDPILKELDIKQDTIALLGKVGSYQRNSPNQK